MGGDDVAQVEEANQELCTAIKCSSLSRNFSKSFVPRSVKRKLKLGKYGKSQSAAQIEKKEAELAAAIAAKEAADRAAKELEEQLKKMESRLDESKVEFEADHFLVAAAAERLYREEELAAAAGARAAAAAYASISENEDLDKTFQCFPVWIEKSTEGEKNGEECGENEKTVSWDMWFRQKTVGPDDQFAAYEVLVGDEDEPIENREWVLAESYEDVLEEVELNGVVEQVLKARKFKFEHGFIIVIDVESLDERSRLLKILGPTKVICLPDSNEEGGSAEADVDGDGALNESKFDLLLSNGKRWFSDSTGDIISDEEEHPVGSVPGIFQRFWSKNEQELDMRAEETVEDESEEEHPIGVGRGLFQRFWLNEGEEEKEWGILKLAQKPKSEFKIGDRVEVRGLFGLEYNNSWRKGTIVGFTKHIPEPFEDNYDGNVKATSNSILDDLDSDSKSNDEDFSLSLLRKEARLKVKEAFTVKATGGFIAMPLVKIDKWDEVYEFEETRKIEEECENDDEMNKEARNLKCTDWSTVDVLTLGLSRRPIFYVGQRVEVKGLYGLAFLMQWRKGVVVGIESGPGLEASKATPATPLVKLGEWEEYYVFDEARPITAFKEVRSAYSGMTYRELLAKQEELRLDILPPLPESIICD